MAKGSRSKGDGSVYQRTDGRWVASIEAGYGPKGRMRRTVTARTRAQVVVKMRALRAEIEAGVVGENPSVAEWLNRWHRDICAPRLKPSTLAGYRGYLDQWLIPTLGGKRLKDLRPEDVRRLHRAMGDDGRAPATIRQAHAILSRALKVAEREGLVLRNVAALVDTPSPGHNPHPHLAPAEAKRVLKAARSPRELARLTCALVLGMRQGEALGLRWADVDLDGGLIEISAARTVVDGRPALTTPKSSSSRRLIPLPAPVAAIMAAWRSLAVDEYVFPGFAGGLEVDARRDWMLWRDALARAGVDHVPLHGARGSAASLLMEMGVPDRVIADILGHAQVTVTQRHYLHSDDRQRRDALETAAKELLG